MIDKGAIQDLFHHMQWADAEVWAAVSKHAHAAEDAKVREYLAHIHTVQRAFLLIWQGQSLEGQFPEFAELSSLKEWALRNFTEIDAYLDALKEDALQQVVKMPWSAMIEQRIGRPPESTTLAETALQVATHSTYHRGQVNARLRELGGEPPLVDYIAWLWLGKPSTKWS